MAEVTETPASPSGWRKATRTFQALNNRNYRLFFFGQLGSFVGTWMQMVAQAWLVLSLTDSPLALATVTTLSSLPMLLFSLFGGVLADRFPKRKLLLTTQSLATVQAIALAALTATGHIQLWQIYVLALLLGISNALDQPARQSFVMEMVGREDLPNAVALNSTLFNVSRILGPALGGLAVATIGFAACFMLNAASFLLVLGALVFMDPKRFFQMPAPARGNVLSRLREGLAYAFRTPDVLLIVIVLAVLGTFGYTFPVSMPLLARFVLETDARGLGFLTAASGLGSLGAALWLAYSRRTTVRVLMLSSSFFSLMLLVVALSRWFPLSVLLLMALGFAGVVFTATAQTRLQLVVPDQFRGRVMGLYTLLFFGTTPIGSLFVGATSERWSVPASFVICAVICWLGVGAGLLYLRAHRSARVAPLPTRVGA